MEKLFIHDGRVDCPRRGQVDIELCLSCFELRDIRDEDGHGVLLCTGQGRTVFDSPAPWQPER